MARGLLIIDIQRDYFPGGAYPLVGPEAAAGPLLTRLQTVGFDYITVSVDYGLSFRACKPDAGDSA